MVRLSVILPTRNRAPLLDDCLASLARQTLATELFELLVVDNGSSDDTARVAQRHADRLPLHYLAEPEAGLHAARHTGLREARADILVFGDDDIVADAGWLASIDEAFRDPEVVLVGGNNRPLFDGPPPPWLTRWWEQRATGRQAISHLSILDLGDGQFDIDPGWVWGCNFSIRRSALLLAGGFHPDAMPAEQLRLRGDGETSVSDAIRKAGLRARFHSGASVAHRVSAERMNADYFERRSYAQGISDSYTDLRRSGGRRSPGTALARRLRAYASTARAISGAGGGVIGQELRAVRRRCLTGYLAGYAYHQKEVVHDPALRTWVLKENYF
jgi:glycosyltransferase involved in cell wall biosynthesis